MEAAKINHRFVTAKGNKVEVIVICGVARNITGFAGHTKAKEAYAVVNGTHKLVVPAGATFKAAGIVAKAGF